MSRRTRTPASPSAVRARRVLAAARRLHQHRRRRPPATPRRGGPIAVKATDTRLRGRRRPRRAAGTITFADHQHRQQGHRVLRVRRRRPGHGRGREHRPRPDPRADRRAARRRHLQTACKPGMVGNGIRGAVHRHRQRRPLGRRGRQARRGHRELPALRQVADRGAGAEDRRSSSTRSRPATSRRPRRCSRSPAPTGSGSSRSRRSSATSTRRSTAARTTSATRAWSSPASTGSRRTSGSTACSPTRRPIADQLMADVNELVSRVNDRRAHPAAAGQRRQGTARRGRHRQDHRRGGPLLAHRPVGLQGQRRGLAGRRRRAAPGARREATRRWARRWTSASPAVDDAARASTAPATAASSTPS